MAATATALMVEPNGRKFRKVAKGTDAAGASANLAKELLLTSGILVNVLVSVPAASLTGFPVKTGTYSDATFHFRNGLENKNVHFEQLDNSYALDDSDGNPTGLVDIDNADIQAWGDANYPGYTLVEGRYIR